MNAARKLKMTYADYLAAESRSDEKHEYVCGDVWAMAGGSIEHARLQSRIIRALGNHLEGRPCEVYSSDLRLRILATDRSTYPDVTVICGPIESAPDDPNAAVNPTLIIEVLSDSTETADRIEKFAHYRRIPSLREYVLVSQKTRRIEVYRREGDFWLLAEAGAGGSAELRSISCALSVDELYRPPVAGA